MWVIESAELRLQLYRREREWDERQIAALERARERLKPEGLVRTMNALRRLALWARSRVLPKSALGQGLRLPSWGSRSYWSLTCITAKAASTNNLVENAIRSSCIGKKNWLFIGHPEAGQRRTHRIVPAPRQGSARLS
jgi:transposase